MNVFNAYAKFLEGNKWFDERDCVDVKDFSLSNNAIEIAVTDGGVILYNYLLDTAHMYRSHDDLIISYTRSPRDGNEFKRIFGCRMYEKIMEKGILQEQLSYVTGISSATISQYISGTVMPTGYNLYKITKALGCTPNDLIGF